MNNQYTKIYFVGIGGIGMSALARYFKHHGVEVIGSDRDLGSDVVKGLIKEGVYVIDQDDLDLSELDDVDCVVYTVAVPDDSPELIKARELNLPLFTYAEMLGEISKDSFTIAVSGTHGKTTVTGMVAEIGKNLNLKPNVIIGSFLNTDAGKTNFVPGDSNLFVVEACEYKRSFLNLSPDVLVINNMEVDHLDYYKDFEDYESAFYELASKSKKIVCDVNDPNLKNIVKEFSDKVVDYSQYVEKVPEMKVFGEHNKRNAAAAVASVISYSDIEEDKVLDAVKTFSGTWRRMEYKGVTQMGAVVYDDYAHHPTEIKVTLDAFREEFEDKKICVVFQPHLHSRTKEFFDEFVEQLKRSDLSLIYPIYKARAEDDYGVSSELLVEKVGETAKFVDSFEKIVEEINLLDDSWVVILLGAGEVYMVAEKLNLR